MLGTATFTVKLDTAPTADVIIPVSTSDDTEGTVSPVSLLFTPNDWNTAQTVTVRGVDDTISDGNIPYTVVLGFAISADPDFNGLNPTDVSVTNTDNDIPPTKFYVVNDGSPDRTYEYGAGGTAVENYSLGSGNTAPRGAASTSAGDKVWVVDANRKVYVCSTSGVLQGSWTDGTSLWVVNDSSTDKVFKYTLSGTLLGSWTISSGGGSPTGITLDPASVSNLWMVDSATDRVYQYDAATNRTSGSQAPSTSFALATGNTNPQGIADPPPPSSELAAAPMTVGESASATSRAATFSADQLDLVSPGSHAAHRLSDPQCSALASRSVDQFMNRLEIELGTARSATNVAWETIPRTRRGISQRSDISMAPLNDDLNTAIDSIVDDLVAISVSRRRT